MIPIDFITEWRQVAPWPSNEQVEQDLVISRAIVEIFNQEQLSTRLAWRGGTALHKLYLSSAPRYSEDIDLVQIDAAPIGDILDILRRVLDPWLGEPRRVFKEGRVNLIYRFFSEGPPVVRLRLKIEINTREHYSECGFVKMPFAVASKWFSGSILVTTYTLDELIGTKLRALYQRKKGRDLFDIWIALQHTDLNPARVLDCFHRYMHESGRIVSRAQFEENMESKRIDPQFMNDITPLLSLGTKWDINAAADAVMEHLISKIPGDPWKVSLK